LPRSGRRGARLAHGQEGLTVQRHSCRWITSGRCRAGAPAGDRPARHRQERLVRRVAQKLGGRCFEYPPGRLTEPSEVFGAVDLSGRPGCAEAGSARRHSRRQARRRRRLVGLGSDSSATSSEPSQVAGLQSRQRR